MGGDVLSLYTSTPTGPQGPTGDTGPTGATGATGPIGPSNLVWGNAGVGITTTRRYLGPGFDQGTATTSPVKLRLPIGRSVTKITFAADAGGSALGSPELTYTLCDGAGASLGLSLTVGVADTTGEATVAPIALLDDQIVTLAVDKSGVLLTSPSNVVIAVG